MIKCFKVKNLFTMLCTMLFILGLSPFTTAFADSIATNQSVSQVRTFDFKENEFSAPAKTGFANWTNQNVVSKHTPHHTGYDEVYKVGQAQSIEGSFKYGDFRVPLTHEWVSIYEYSLDSKSASWVKIGRALTDESGNINYALPSGSELGVGLHLIKLYVEGDGTEADMYLQVLNSSNKYVVFDVDGTLTTSNLQSFEEYFSEFYNGNYVPKVYPCATDVVNYYASEGYGILYLTARPNWLSGETQRWLAEEGFPMGLIHTSTDGNLILGEAAATFKTNYLNQLQGEGVQFTCGYGNESTDVEAYSNVGISKSNIYTIGPNAGIGGSTPVTSYEDNLKQISENH